VAFDKKSRLPVSRQLEEQLRDAIQSGRLSPGQALPSTRMLAEDLAVSRGVVVRAYTQLAAEGYLVLRQGANPRVSTIGVLQTPPPSESPPKARRFRYDLRPERPDLSQFPRRLWLRSVRQALLTAADSDVGYIDRHGLRGLREEIARYLVRARGVAATPDRVVITAGSTHALTLIERVLRQRGEQTIAFENPSHLLFHTLARRTELLPIGVTVDEQGLVVDELAASRAPAVVVSPAHQFPTGVAASVTRRAELLRWAEATGGLILENDYDAEFRYDRAPIGALQGLAPEHVAYIGSTSKTLAPGLRLGWAVLPTDLVDAAAEELWSMTLHLPGLDQLAFADFMRRGEFDRHLRRMRTLYRRRRDLLVRALQRELPQFPLSGIAAGLHLVLELPTQADEEEARRRARQHGLAIESLSQHALPNYHGPLGLLIGYGTIPEPTIPLAVRELARALTTATSTPAADALPIRHVNGSRHLARIR
jgi:GntR family transcriptional regulator / MocR family aminotransferase